MSKLTLVGKRRKIDGQDFFPSDYRETKHRARAVAAALRRGGYRARVLAAPYWTVVGVESRRYPPYRRTIYVVWRSPLEIPGVSAYDLVRGV